MWRNGRDECWHCGMTDHDTAGHRHPPRKPATPPPEVPCAHYVKRTADGVAWSCAHCDAPLPEARKCECGATSNPPYGFASWCCGDYPNCKQMAPEVPALAGAQVKTAELSPRECAVLRVATMIANGASLTEQWAEERAAGWAMVYLAEKSRSCSKHPKVPAPDEMWVSVGADGVATDFARSRASLRLESDSVAVRYVRSRS